MDRDRVAGLGAFEVERAGLRIHERELADLGDQVVLAANPAEERVLSEDIKYHRSLDPPHRRGPAERPGVLIGFRPETDYLKVGHVAMVHDRGHPRLGGTCPGIASQVPRSGFRISFQAYLPKEVANETQG